MIPFKKTAMLREAETTPGYRIWLEILLFIGVFFVSQLAMGIPVGVAEVFWLVPHILEGELPDMQALLNDMPDWLLLVQLFSTAIITFLTLLFCKTVQKRKLPSVGFRKPHALREYLLGALIGILLFAAAVGICALTGSVKLETSKFSVVMWLLFFVGFLIQGMSEEVLCRGYFMPSVARRHPLWLAVLLNSLLFSLLHAVNPSVTPLALLNILLFGVLISLYVLRRGDIWGACAMHSLWNFVQGNVFGISVSGTGSGASPLTATLPEGKALWNGGSFGLEGGLAVTLVLAVGILLIVFLLPNEKEPEATEPDAQTAQPEV